MRVPHPLLALAPLVAPLFVATAARAQTIMLGLPTPLRYIGSQQPAERPLNLNPLGVNYSDCIQDMYLQYSLVLSGFTGQNLEIWASATGSCQSDQARGFGYAPTCWQLNGGAVGINQPTTYSRSVNVRVQDLVGSQQSVPATRTPVNWGVAACHNQPSFSAVPITLSFVPTTSAGNAMGTGLDVTVNTDLMGPPPPTGIGESVGSMLFNVTWTPNVDTDTAGYDLYIAANGAGADAVAPQDASDASEFNVLVCPDAEAGSPSSSSGGSSEEGGEDATPADATPADATLTDAAVTEASSASSGCYYVVSSPPPPGSVPNAGMCMNAILSQAFVSDGGSTITVIEDAGTEDGGAITESTGGGGISEIPPSYLVDSNGTTTMTVSAEGVSTYTIGGLTNGTTYNVVVSAVDGSGNIGPPSTEVCDFPAPVNDFFQTYRMDGGQAGGGFCTLENVGAPQGCSIVSVAFGALAFGFARRRRRRGPADPRGGGQGPADPRGGG